MNLSAIAISKEWKGEVGRRDWYLPKGQETWKDAAVGNAGLRGGFLGKEA